MKCPKCGKEMDLYEKDTSSGRDMRTYVCRPCDKWVDGGQRRCALAGAARGAREGEGEGERLRLAGVRLADRLERLSRL